MALKYICMCIGDIHGEMYLGVHQDKFLAIKKIAETGKVFFFAQTAFQTHITLCQCIKCVKME